MNLNDVLELHSVLIKKFGGTEGLRDEGLLLSALNRPFATFGGEDLYPDAVDKAAAIFESVILNHPFSDGNKRTGYVLMRLVLMDSGYDITASHNEKYDFVISATKGEHNIESIKEWIRNHLIP